MQDGIPITLNADNSLAASVKTLHSSMVKIEAWINFQALKADWYGDENKILSFDITLTTVEQFKAGASDRRSANWREAADSSYACCHNSADLSTVVFIPVPAAVVEAGANAFEHGLQAVLSEAVNSVGGQYGLQKL